MLFSSWRSPSCTRSSLKGLRYPDKQPKHKRKFFGPRDFIIASDYPYKTKIWEVRSKGVGKVNRYHSNTVCWFWKPTYKIKVDFRQRKQLYWFKTFEKNIGSLSLKTIISDSWVRPKAIDANSCWYSSRNWWIMEKHERFHSNFSITA